MLLSGRGGFLTEGMRDSPLADDELLHCSLQARAVFRSLGLMLLLQDFRVMVYRAYTFWGCSPNLRTLKP